MEITADASNVGIGAFINKIQNGEYRPLGFFSRKLSEAERRTSRFGDLCVREWGHDLLDPGNVTIFTDHKPIVGAFNSDKQRLSDKQQRQLSFISEYLSDIVHLAGNVVADSSRVASINASTAPPTCDLPAIAKMQAKEARHYEEFKAFDIGIKNTPSVSYTHLTLPTIYSV